MLLLIIPFSFQHGPVVPRLPRAPAHLGRFFRVDRGSRNRRGPGGRHLQSWAVREVHGHGSPHNIPVMKLNLQNISSLKYISAWRMEYLDSTEELGTKTPSSLLLRTRSGPKSRKCHLGKIPAPCKWQWCLTFSNYLCSWGMFIQLLLRNTR